MASFNVQSLRPDITAILASADRSSVSAKAVRKALQSKYPELNVKLHKAEIDEMTTAIFTASPDPAAVDAPKPHLPSFHKLKRERSPSGEPTSSPAFPLEKVKGPSKYEESDEELARRLQAEYAQPVGRATRNGGANSKPRKPIKKKKSKSRVSDDDDDDDDDKPKKKRKVSQTGFNKPHLLSPEMAEVCGQEVLSRPGVTKALWNLQDPNKKTDILPDETLKRVLPFDRIKSVSPFPALLVSTNRPFSFYSSFTMAKHISPHLFPYDPEEHGHLSGAVEPVENEVKSEDLVNSDSE
ncbi:SPOSA6832_04889 [Sporobolomyces salmonicolor]|uniref:SPOSA6832_04889-mRNA-1:cds n=1 Tax=Sporidiobolus salmonicolor TaxID=5005 RepID=A0A0D6ET90_SPOSA|nr:SPOSA6832_04889 [Sporobolomyces salmonicolor]